MALLFVASPQQIKATEINSEQPERDFVQITITMENNQLRICGAYGQEVKIYNILGKIEKIYKVDSNDKRIDLPLKKGYYIVKVGAVVRKIALH